MIKLTPEEVFNCFTWRKTTYKREEHVFKYLYEEISLSDNFSIENIVYLYNKINKCSETVINPILIETSKNLLKLQQEKQFNKDFLGYIK